LRGPQVRRTPTRPRQSGGGIVEAALEEALEVLEEFPRPLTPSRAREALEPVAQKAGVPIEVFARRALEEATGLSLIHI